jgi:hypothetical protein
MVTGRLATAVSPLASVTSTPTFLDIAFPGLRAGQSNLMFAEGPIWFPPQEILGNSFPGSYISCQVTVYGSVAEPGTLSAGPIDVLPSIVAEGVVVLSTVHATSYCGVLPQIILHDTPGFSPVYILLSVWTFW